MDFSYFWWLIQYPKSSLDSSLQPGGVLSPKLRIDQAVLAWEKKGWLWVYWVYIYIYTYMYKYIYVYIYMYKYMYIYIIMYTTIYVVYVYVYIYTHWTEIGISPWRMVTWPTRHRWIHPRWCQQFGRGMEKPELGQSLFRRIEGTVVSTITRSIHNPPIILT